MNDLIVEFIMEYIDLRFVLVVDLRNIVYNMDLNVLYDGGNGCDVDDVFYVKLYLC